MKQVLLEVEKTESLCANVFKTVFRYRHIYPMAIEAVASGKVNLKGIVTNVFDFDDIQNAMDQSVHDKANIVKSVVKIQ